MEAVKNFLKSVENVEQLKLKLLEKGIVFNEMPEKKLIILKYDKPNPLCDLSDEFTSYCRGLVLDTTNLNLVCIPPEKAYKYSELIPHDIDYSKLVFEEFYDGTMINLWFHNNEWNISTRSKIDAECKWYSDKTFKELFYEAVEKDNLKINELNKNICHSFLLKHQENRIVKKYNTPGLVLVHCIDMETHKLISNEDIKELYKKEGVHINVAKKYDFKDIESISNHMNDLTFESQGLVIKYNNYRTKIRNQNYNFVKNMRGNTPKVLNHYLELRKRKLVKQFLYYYPEYKEEFRGYMEEINRMTGLLHHCYKGNHIHRRDTNGYLSVNDIPYELKPLVYELHGNYLKSNRTQKITYDYVKFYFNNLPIPKMIFVLNYQKNNKH